MATVALSAALGELVEELAERVRLAGADFEAARAEGSVRGEELALADLDVAKMQHACVAALVQGAGALNARGENQDVARPH